jgi:glycosyltransferase involved in cell wall biosynthesis
MKIYIPTNKPDDQIGGGFTFRRNFIKGCQGKAEIVNTLQECDVMLVSGITMVEGSLLTTARELKKKVVLRVDNVPRKSRNKRCTPHQRLQEYAKLSDLIIYQSEWAERYIEPLCGKGKVIYNGVDTEVFNHNDNPDERENVYTFIYHGGNELKGFWTAHYLFQMEARDKKEAEFWFIYDFGKAIHEFKEGNFDFWNNEKYIHLPKETDPRKLADIMRQAKYLIYPAVCDASPNVVGEAMACGCSVIGAANGDLSGTTEVILKNAEKPYTIQDMCDDYLNEFNLLK